MDKIIMISQANGGVGVYLKNFIRYIDTTKFEVELILSKQFESEITEYNEYKYTIHFVDMVRNFDVKKDFKAALAIRKIIKSKNPQVVYAHSSKAGFLTRIAISAKTIPIMYNAHGWAFNMNTSSLKTRIYTFIEKILSFNTSKIVVISEFEKDRALNKKVCKESDLILIKNGIDLHEINFKEKIIKSKNEILSLFNIPIDAIIIGQVGRLDEQKNPHLFVEVAKELNHYNSNMYFFLVGDGKLRKAVELQIEQLNLKEKVIITGWISNTVEYINLFDIGILTSQWEGFGLVLAEYMLAKKPVVASDVGGIPNVVQHNKTGILCNKNDKMEFVAAIKTIIQDEKLSQRLSKNGFETAKVKFSFERVMNEHYDLLFKILN